MTVEGNRLKALVTPEVLTAFYEAYVISKEEDKHTIFAEAVSMDRIDAKQLAFYVAYIYSKSEVMQVFQESINARNKNASTREE